MRLELQGISKSYNKKTEPLKVLEDINLTVKEGERIIITGASGAGKSTLLNILGLVDNDFEGEYLLDGKSYKKLKEKEISKLRNETFGFIFQEYALIEEDTVFDNVKIPLLYSDEKRRNYRKRVIEILERVGLQEKIDKKVCLLSGGERQRVAIARALVNNPQIILADEPTSSLDDERAKQIIDIIYNYLDETSILLLVTHDLQRLSGINEKIIRLEKGRKAI